ncbi:OPT family small oligopeptide transporter [Pilobolus umbonatus]|nr:OPT family small oligopeptide transporter [Pilobolus umbonatus]
MSITSNSLPINRKEVYEYSESAASLEKVVSYFDKVRLEPEKLPEVVELDDSPIEEVRAVVSKQNALTLSPLVVQLLTFPLGKLLARIIPKSFFFNPGPFNMKEHVLITAMANCSFSTAYAIDIITIQRLFYNQNLGWGGGILLIWTTQLIGFGMAGVLRPYLVYPSAMVWPSNLANISLFRSFHEPTNSWSGPSRIQWFSYCFGAMFIYYWLPGYFFQVLTFFSWICWVNPTNRTLAQLTGAYNGLGMLSVSFDWATITSYLSSPLLVPFWAIANIGAGFVFVAWIAVPLLYYTDVWDSQTFPIITSALFNKNGELWNNTLVLNEKNVLDPVLYEQHGPLRMTSFFAFTYGIGFAGIASILTHTALYHGRDIITQFRNSRSKKNTDIHHKLMQSYDEVPHLWYIIVFFSSFCVSFAVIYCWPIYLPWWGLILAICIPVIFVLPIGIIQAVTNQQPGLNVLTEFIIGFALPGHPIANVTFKTYGYISMTQCLTFISDLKLGHYTKIPPRAMFWAQMTGTIIAGFINLSTATWLMDTVPHICTPKGYPFTCPSARTFYSASVIWGAIGPQRMFGPESPYNAMLWLFPIGLLLPIPFYLLSKKYPKSWIKHIHFPLMFNATGMMPPAVPLNFSMWFSAGFVFMYWIRKHHHEWWVKYNYITSAAFDSGVAISAIVIFGVVAGFKYTPKWWGNGSYDYNGTFDNCPLAGANASDVCAICH